jgi:glyoxylase-like metal-dependent hydrolase (beta-lactamase superfamily II)
MDKKEIKQYTSNEGARVFQIPVEAFPGFWAFAYLVFFQDYTVLIDTGSGYGDSDLHLESGLTQISEIIQSPVTFDSLTHVLITHGHIDHFGGLSKLKGKTSARIGVHPLDLRNLTNIEERLVIVRKRLELFLLEAGVSEERVIQLSQMYSMTKLNYRAVNIDFTYDQIGMKLGPFEFIHVPGHCAGHVVVKFHDLLFSGDHILAGISPHQAPEKLTLNTGLSHYLESLSSLEGIADQITLVLPGHNAVIKDLQSRIGEITKLHEERLEQVLELLEEPRTISQLSKLMFGEVHTYTVLLALEEAGAHVEYLMRLGLLRIENIEEYENCKICAVKYIRAKNPLIAADSEG